MSKVDDELSRRFHRAERPIGSGDLFDGVARRRRRRRTLQRLEAGALAIVVIAGTVGGFVALRAAFREEPGRDVGEAPLPSNGLIVFARDAADGTSHLYTMDPDGTGLRQLTDLATSDSAPAVSPDGRHVGFLHGVGDLTPMIGTIPIDGGAVTWLTDERLFVTDGPSWSPDGSRVAFAAHDSEGQRLFVMNSDGSQTRAITAPDLYWVTGAAWSPDGSTIAFTASLVDGAGEPSTWDVFTVRPDGTHLRNVTLTPSAEDDEYGPAWSPDGSKLVFSRDDGRGSVLVVRDLGDATETVLTDGHVDDGPAWSPDGTLIAFNRAPLEGGGFDVWAVRPDGSEPTRLTRDGGFNPSWQPIPPGSAVTPEPSASPSPEPEGVAVGLAFRLCESKRLGGIDFLGRGTDGYAWIGVPAKDDGTCPKHHGAAAYVVAADANGDGRAETFTELPWKCYVDCVPFDAADLDGNGTEELVVASFFSIMDYYVMRYLGPPDEPSPVIVPVLVAEPGHPAVGLDAGRPMRIDAGGDAGYGSQIECEEFPGPVAPVIVWSWSWLPVESERDREVHITRIQIRADGQAHVIGTNDYTVPFDQPSGIDRSEAPACGVDWHPNA
jgi:Tol biopolymer transport system component